MKDVCDQQFVVYIWMRYLILNLHGLYLWPFWPNMLCLRCVRYFHPKVLSLYLRVGISCICVSIFLYLCEMFPTECTWSVFVCVYFLYLCKYFRILVWDISDRMYLVWVVMHLLMGTICAGGRLSPSSPLTPTNFTRSNCLDFFFIFFWQLIIPRNFCISVH